MGGVGRFVFNVKTKVKNIVQKNIEINDMINSNNELYESFFFKIISLLSPHKIAI